MLFEDYNILNIVKLNHKKLLSMLNILNKIPFIIQDINMSAVPVFRSHIFIFRPKLLNMYFHLLRTLFIDSLVFYPQMFPNSKLYIIY